jgi:hypothetical protein
MVEPLSTPDKGVTAARGRDSMPIMSAPPPPEARTPGPQPTGGDVLVTLVSAGLFLYIGFGLGLRGISGEALYDGSVAALVWGARCVGIGTLVALAMAYLRVPGMLTLDLVLSAAAAAGCLVIGVIWIVSGDNEGFLLLLFGLLNGSAARSAWQRWRGARRGGAPAP